MGNVFSAAWVSGLELLTWPSETEMWRKRQLVRTSGSCLRGNGNMRLIWSFNRARAEMVANENFAGAFRRAERGESVEHRHGGQMPEARYRLLSNDFGRTQLS